MEFRLGIAIVSVDRPPDYYIAAPIRLMGDKRPRHTRAGHVYQDPAYKKFKDDFRHIVKKSGLPFKTIKYRGKFVETLDDGWMFVCNACFSDDRMGDRTNLIKSIEDALWAQDKHVVGLVEVYPKFDKGDLIELYFWKL